MATIEHYFSKAAADKATTAVQSSSHTGPGSTLQKRNTTGSAMRKRRVGRPRKNPTQPVRPTSTTKEKSDTHETGE